MSEQGVEHVQDDVKVEKKGKRKKSKAINVSEEISELYKTQRARLDVFFTKEHEKQLHLREATENVVITMKMLEIIHAIQSEKNIEDAIDSKDEKIEGILEDIDDEEEG